MKRFALEENKLSTLQNMQFVSLKPNIFWKRTEAQLSKGNMIWTWLHSLISIATCTRSYCHNLASTYPHKIKQTHKGTVTEARCKCCLLKIELKKFWKSLRSFYVPIELLEHSPSVVLKLSFKGWKMLGSHSCWMHIRVFVLYQTSKIQRGSKWNLCETKVFPGCPSLQKSFL